MQPDSKLNHYRIIAKIGEGGMGQVFRAVDETLKREVAIKILPPQLAQNPERLARLEREAQVLAQVEHANIASIYGLEQATPEGGDSPVRLLVMQLAEGDTLAERIDQAPIPVEEALTIGLQIARALETAHEHGIVHRDLKPANVMLSAGGDVKLLDFGLAKAFASDSMIASAPEVSASPTMLEATMAGAIMGTAGYMSPEQARGKPVDRGPTFGLSAPWSTRCSPATASSAARRSPTYWAQSCIVTPTGRRCRSVRRVVSGHCCSGACARTSSAVSSPSAMRVCPSRSIWRTR